MKKTISYLSSITLSLLASASMSAEVTGVRVSDGEESVIFYLEDKPEVTFTTTDLVMETPDHRVEFPMTSTVTFEFTDDSGVDITVQQSVRFNVFDNEVRAQGLTPYESVRIYSYSGKIISSSHADSTGEWSISIELIPSEPVIIRTNKYTYKILTRK